MEPILKIKNLEISFELDDIFYKAIKNVSFDFYKGKMHAIVGESGCGKTVTQSAILKLLPKNASVDCGEILYDGINLLNLSENDMRQIRGRKIALIPQDPMTSLNPLYTIENQLFETIFLHNKISKEKAQELAFNTLYDVGIENVKNVMKSYPNELSGGMKQRIIIAMALLANAEIIIADEPTTALDVTIQAQILDLLQDIKSHGTTIILITHNLAIVSKYCDDVSVMYMGEVAEYAPTRELFKSPKHPYTKALIEALPTDRNKELKNLKGQPSSIKEKIAGCAFHQRCDEIVNKCKVENPCIIEVSQNHFVKCHLFDNLL